MTDKGKKIFLGICIILPFLFYCFYYYSIMLKNAPYRFSDFESLTLKYGLGDSLVNSYDSQTGTYQYVNHNDSLIRTTVRLRKDDLLYLHRKAAELGFWNFPDKIVAENQNDQGIRAPRYFLEFRYKEKTKQVLFDPRYNEQPKLRDAAKSLITEVSNMINDTQDRNRN